MTARPEPFFSWTARRVELDELRESESAVLVLDEVVPVGAGTARLIATRDEDTDIDYLALIVGDVADGHDIAVRGVDEEALLIEGSRTESSPEILIGLRAAQSICGCSDARHVDSQLCLDGPIRTMIASIGVRSVVVDWYHVISAVA
ncbi:hypothetical protein SIM91_06425 [Rhodococcus opacus]|uniref:hypothetical protein n=1 Tax=Rhodococcus opacus TaxID=37919 RepID=UPI0002A1C04F|nr:hypothetical protein [Rhodococcus opacus]ELB92679.1 hypothetical protein Rwratislav_12893 [Rhodococcus wratislaviensis IFP 2016]MDX5962949.1 hypothetical protein [Rhodococcus opacus]NKY69837.1 hypothetical protein [Rhodococcus opacus]CAG7599686.1 hypothetical protein E143388_04780 [Rhodococcus opacus]